MKVTPVLEIPRTEERSTELSIREQALRDRLCNGALPRSRQPVQPEDRRPIEIPRPQFDLVQDGSASPLQTSFAVTIVMSIFGSFRAAKVIEDLRFSC